MVDLGLLAVITSPLKAFSFEDDDDDDDDGCSDE